MVNVWSTTAYRGGNGMAAKRTSGYKHNRKRIYASNSSSRKSKGGCYIATSVYGSYDCPQVWILRRYRDYELARTWYGRVFIKVYYAISPTLVKWFGNTKWFRCLWKHKLDDIVNILHERGIENTPYKDHN